jgi:DNA-binding NarL/FixJ family response regulator
VQPIRIAVVDLQRFTREVIKEVVAGEHDMEIAAEFPDLEDLVQAADDANANFVIAATDLTGPAEVHRLLEARPWVKVLGISSDARQSFLYELRPQMVPLGEVSPQTLLEAIRTVAATGAAVP